MTRTGSNWSNLPSSTIQPWTDSCPLSPISYHILIIFGMCSTMFFLCFPMPVSLSKLCSSASFVPSNYTFLRLCEMIVVKDVPWFGLMMVAESNVLNAAPRCHAGARLGGDWTAITYNCGEKFPFTHKDITVFSSNEFYSSHFSLMEWEGHILLSHKKHSWSLLQI